MNTEENEIINIEKDKEPIFFTPKRVTLVSDTASILSWIVLVGFICDIVVQVLSLQAQMKTGNLIFSTLIHEASFIAYLFVNIAIPFLTGLGIFVILQAAAAVLNILLEMDYNAREAKR